MAKPLAGLTRKQLRFVTAYALSGQGRESALRAGYSAKGAAQAAVKLLGTPAIAAMISKEQSDVALANKITQEYFITKLKGIVEEIGAKNTDKIGALTLLARVTGHIKETAVENKTMVIVNTIGDKDEKTTINVPKQPQ